jgi:Ni/Fe-hydrogenase subunit HybB-like protein
MAESMIQLEELKKLAPPAELRRAPVVENNRGLGALTDQLAKFAEGKCPRWWLLLFSISAFFATVVLPVALIYQTSTGVGVWGNNHPVMWGLDIVSFIWWVGVAHAGTLISALLFLTRQHWRTTIGRAAEAMTVFSVMMAGLYPAIHVGRAWFDWFMFPVPNSNDLWPQFRSPLMWDVFAVNTYLVVSMLFWFMGMIPDFAVLRDRSTTRVRKFIFSLVAMGWTGSARQWHHYEKAYVVLCGLCTLLVFTVSSIVGLDFCTAQIAGWHATIFPLYFVIGAVFCGFGMILVLLIPLRKWCGLENIITMSHMDKVAKLTLVSGLIIAYIYAMEFFIAWYSNDPYERWVFGHRLFGHTYWVLGWILIVVNVGVTQLLWFKKIRANLTALFIIGVLINIGMFTERFVIVVGSLYQDFLPANWGVYMPTRWDVALFTGTLGAFFMMYLLFVKFLPFIAISEVKGATPQGNPHHPLGDATKGAKS